MHYEWNAGAKDSSKQTMIAKRGQMVDPSDDFTNVFTYIFLYSNLPIYFLCKQIDIMDINRLYECPTNSYI